ncbi:uncharacterized protein LOC113385819 [Ctenocephalides felis]|uniref:uncharacterized protein LOC113385819 n=1 Tax=Ctenocephalides felis TaxID=7515 RepID=UPI000E6E492B|nr:uncharacterized protein LOC113385819 [Ctenocephalides felis]
MDNFLDMISKLRIESKSERSLTLNLNSKISTIKWRVNVLQKLQLMLQVLVDFMRNNSGIEKGNQDIEVTQNYSFRETIPVYLGVYDDHNLKINGLGLFSGSNKNFNASLTQEMILKVK